jgi:hypothetical protein
MGKVDILGALSQGQKAVPMITSIFVGITLALILVGVLIQQGASGNIPLPSAITTFLNGDFITNIVSAFTSVTTVVITIVALLIVVALIILFRGYLGGSGKGKQM